MPPTDLVLQMGEVSLHTHEFVLYPKSWAACSCLHSLAWHAVRLQHGQEGGIPHRAGVYTLLIQPGILDHPACSYLMYVGRSKDLRRRFAEYLDERKRYTGRPLVYRVLALYPAHTWFAYAQVPRQALCEVECNLIAAYIPPANDRLEGDLAPAVRAFR